MTEFVRLDDPTPLRRYAENARAAARMLLEVTGPHAPIGQGPTGLFSDPDRGMLTSVDAANEQNHDLMAELLTDAYRLLGGTAYAADYIAVELPAVDQSSTPALHDLAYRAHVAVPRIPETAPETDLRFVSPPVPR